MCVRVCASMNLCVSPQLLRYFAGSLYERAQTPVPNPVVSGIPDERSPGMMDRWINCMPVCALVRVLPRVCVPVAFCRKLCGVLSVVMRPASIDLPGIF